MTAPTPASLATRGRNMVPAGYRGWVMVKTPTGRRKVRYVRDGLVYRDDQGHEPCNPRPVAEHAIYCRVEPVTVERVGSSMRTGGAS